MCGTFTGFLYSRAPEQLMKQCFKQKRQNIRMILVRAEVCKNCSMLYNETKEFLQTLIQQNYSIKEY